MFHPQCNVSKNAANISSPCGYLTVSGAIAWGEQVYRPESPGWAALIWVVKLQVTNVQVVSFTRGQFYQSSVLPEVSSTKPMFYKRSVLQVVSSTSGQFYKWSVLPDMEKDIFFLTQTRFYPKLFYQKKWENFDKSEYATMSKTRQPHMYRGKNYVIILISSSF